MKRKFSIAHLSALQVPPQNMVYLAAAAGFDYVSIRPVLLGTPGEPNYAVDLNPEMYKEFDVAMAETGMKLSDIELFRLTDEVDMDKWKPAFEFAQKHDCHQDTENDHVDCSHSQPEYSGKPLDEYGKCIRPQLRKQEQRHAKVRDRKAHEQDDQRLRPGRRIPPGCVRCKFFFLCHSFPPIPFFLTGRMPRIRISADSGVPPSQKIRPTVQTAVEREISCITI